MPSQFVTLTVDGSPMKTWVAVPSGRGPFPGVVIAQHAGGLDTFIRNVCDRLAEAGFAAAAGDMYHRQDGMTFEELAAIPADDPTRFEKMMAKAGRMKDDEIERDMNATLAHLRSLPQVGGSPVGVMGFCGGGRVAYMMAALQPEFAASAVFHPGGVGIPRDGRTTAIDLTPKIKAPMAGFFGKDDQNPSPEHVAQMDAALTKNGVAHRFHSYDGTGHSFLDYTNPKAHRPGPAKDAWEKLVAFFNETLKAAVPA